MTSDDRATNIAAVDLGTNSFHLVVARLTSGTRFHVLTREKAMVRLGSGASDMKDLAPDAIERAVSTLARYRAIAEAHGATVRAVATSAVREADNRDVLLARARAEAGIEIEVISGLEEARLIHLGVLQAVPIYDRRALLCDIGGGSTELMIVFGGEMEIARSLKLGAIRLTNRFFHTDRLHPGAVSACRSFVRSALAPFVREIESSDFEIAVGSSGTISAVATMVQAATAEPPPLTLNNFRFDVDDLSAVVEALAEAPTVAARRTIAGLDANRADIILAGALILEGVFHETNAKSMVVSDYALREGVLLDTAQRLWGGSLHHLRDVSRRGVEHLADLLDDDVDHSRHVARLALELFEQTARQHRLDPTAAEYLEAAARLANIGLSVSHSKHHLHSYYIIRNSERLVGLTDREIEIIAQVARYHRKSSPKVSHSEFGRLWPEDQELVRVLAALLRIAIGLDRNRRGVVHHVRTHSRAGKLVITAEHAPGVDASLEVYTANERRGLLEEVLGRQVSVTAAARATASAQSGTDL